MQKQDPATFRLETQLKSGSNAAEILGHGPPSLMLMVMMMMLTLMMIVRILMIIPMTQPGSPRDEDDDDEDDHNARFPRTSLSEPPSLMLMVMTMLMTTMAHLSHDLEEQAPFLRRPSSTVIRHLVTLIQPG